MKLSKRNRFLLVFTMLVSLFTVNCSLFAVTASANASSDPNQIRSLGVPISMECYLNRAPSDGVVYDVLLNSPNVYYYDLDTNTPSWVNGLDGSPPVEFFAFDYSVVDTGVADIFIDPAAPCYVHRFSSSIPILVSSKDDSRQNYDMTLGIYNATDGAGNPIDSIQVYYELFYISVSLNGGEPSYLYSSYGRSVTLNRNGNYFYVQLLDPALTSSFLSDSKNFVDEDGVSYVWILEASASIRTSCYSSSLYLEPFYKSANQPLSDFKYMLDRRVISVFDSDVTQVSFDGISWTDWLVSSVGSFMNFQIVPGLTLSGILGLLIGMSLFMVFLKVFAGG